MAKNLKLNVKNTQLAEALNIGKVKIVKKAVAKKLEPQDEKKSEQPPAEEAQPKKQVKATLEPKKVVAQPAAKVDSRPKVAIGQIVPPRRPRVVEKEETPVKNDQKKPARLSPSALRNSVTSAPKKPERVAIGTIRPGTTKQDVIRKAENEPKTTASTTVKPAPRVVRVKEDDRKQPRSAKAGKLQDSKSFDSRDKQGLRSNDDESWRRRRGHGRSRIKQHKEIIEPVRPSEISVKLPISLKDLAHEMKIKSAEIIQKLFLQGMPVTINDVLDDETLVGLIGDEIGCAITIDKSEAQHEQLLEKSVKDEISESASEQLVSRAPVVTFMGHVDHGKTSLIDALRNSNVASGEAGAITQHIGAFRVDLEKGLLTILDTPGHEAFSAMRQRGTTVTDIVVLVVAGDEGFKPQTDEALEKAKQANAQIVVAVNKCDKQSYNIEEIYRQLADREMLPEAWGGDVITVKCSAQSGEGISDLLDMLLLQSELLELKANPTTRARGTVIESEIQKGLGNTATLLIQNGTLKKGDPIVIDSVYGKVKTMHNENGKPIESAGPSEPVKITGLSGSPSSGCEFIVPENDKEAKKLAEQRSNARKKEKVVQASSGGLEALLLKSKESESKKVCRIILKSDVAGSLDAIKNSLRKIKSDKVELQIVKSEIGDIAESEVQMALSSDATIIGFHVGVEAHAEPIIKTEHVKVETFDVIYHLIDHVKELMRSTLDKVRQEEKVGTVRIQTVFSSSHLGQIAGCIVTDGTVKRNHHMKLVRDSVIAWEGPCQSLKRVRDDVKEVSKGIECGVLLGKNVDIQENDIIEAYQITFVEQEL